MLVCGESNLRKPGCKSDIQLRQRPQAKQGTKFLFERPIRPSANMYTSAMYLQKAIGLVRKEGIASKSVASRMVANIALQEKRYQFGALRFKKISNNALPRIRKGAPGILNAGKINDGCWRLGTGVSQNTTVQASTNVTFSKCLDVCFDQLVGLLDACIVPVVQLHRRARKGLSSLMVNKSKLPHASPPFKSLWLKLPACQKVPSRPAPGLRPPAERGNRLAHGGHPVRISGTHPAKRFTWILRVLLNP